MQEHNVIVCPRCGEEKLRTPPGTTVLPTFGTASKLARGASGMCECGKRRLDEDDPDLD